MMPFPIVGVGASAGGLEALSSFIEGLDPDRSLAYVVVQHLSPHHKSALTELLAARTRLRVEEASDGLLISPKVIYVIPCNSVMTIDDGHLVISPRLAAASPPTPIDRLFESLADEEGHNAVGIILSGTGSDGASGLKAIKNAGGLTFAQNEETAKFFGMPKAAIDLDAVDRVLPPAQIAAELMGLLEHPYFSRTATASSPDLGSDSDHDGLIRKILIELKVRTGVDFTLYKRGTISRRLAKRLAVNGVSGLRDYLTLLKSSREESEILSRELLIQVTDFFRDPDVFEGLSHLVLPHLFDDRAPNRPVRIWVPGCSSGEEVYTLAMTVLEYLGPDSKDPSIQLFGTDLSESAIEIARAGIYPETISRHVSEDRLRRFFEKKNGGYRISRLVRDLCVFARQNVVDDPPFSRIDLISCRNLLIYLDPALQKKVMTLFHYALKPGGYLLLGPSETVGASSELFSPIDKRLRIFSKKLLPGRNIASLLDHPDRLPQVPIPRKMMPSVEQPESERLLQEADRIAMRRFVPPGVLCDSDFNILQYRGDTTPFLGNPIGPPSHNLQKLIKPELLVDLCNAIESSRARRETTLCKGLRIEGVDEASSYSAEIMPFGLESPEPTWFWVFFVLEGPQKKGKGAGHEGFLEPLLKSLFPNQQRADEKNNEILRLAKDLEATRSYVLKLMEAHEAATEELKAAEEELLSSNEEFQSTNEELETAQEELQSSNDELRSRNRELNFLNEELIHSRDFSEAIVETVHQPLLVMDGNMMVQRANRAFYRVFQARPEQTENQPFFEMGQGQWAIPELRNLLEEILPSHTCIEGKEIRVSTSKLGVRTLRLNAQSLRWNQEARILMAIEDVSEHEGALEELRLMDRRKDEFMAMLAHELRNPLTPIRNALEIWRMGTAAEAEIRKAQDTMDRQLTQEARLIEELLDLSRINRGAIALRKEVVDFARITQETLNDIQTGVESHQQTLNLNISQIPVIIEGDKARLSQIVFNLLNNAIKYTPKGGTISVALVREGAQAMLSVADNGDGIAPDLMDSIFDLFVQADKSLARSEGGLGIGLTLVRRLVELHGGQVHAFSEGLGKGSCFTVRIPALPDSTKLVASEPDQALVPTAHGNRRILVVDDNVDAAESLALLLQLEGFTTEVAFDGPGALQVAGAFSPDIIFLDIGLPGLDGYKVAAHIRSMKELRQPLLIALSGYGQASDKEKSEAAGFDHHLVKPADIDLIRTLIHADSKG
jgi:two-component system CheB/CheR fusion protein